MEAVKSLFYSFVLGRKINQDELEKSKIKNEHQESIISEENDSSLFSYSNLDYINVSEEEDEQHDYNRLIKFKHKIQNSKRSQSLIKSKTPGTTCHSSERCSIQSRNKYSTPLFSELSGRDSNKCRALNTDETVVSDLSVNFDFLDINEPMGPNQPDDVKIRKSILSKNQDDNKRKKEVAQADTFLTCSIDDSGEFFDESKSYNQIDDYEKNESARKSIAIMAVSGIESDFDEKSNRSKKFNNQISSKKLESNVIKKMPTSVPKLKQSKSDVNIKKTQIENITHSQSCPKFQNLQSNAMTINISAKFEINVDIKKSKSKRKKSNSKPGSTTIEPIKQLRTPRRNIKKFNALYEPECEIDEETEIILNEMYGDEWHSPTLLKKCLSRQ